MTKTVSDIIGKEPPKDVVAEQQVIGSILKDENALDVVIESGITADTFYHPKHQLIFRAIWNLHKEGTQGDITTAADELAKMGKLEDVGGRLYLIELVDGIASTANIQAHIDIIIEKAQLRQNLLTANWVIDACLNGTANSCAINKRLQANIDESAGHKTEPLVVFVDLIPDVIEHLDKVNRGEKKIGITTHLPDLNRHFLLEPGRTICVAAPPGQGKTALVLNFAEHVAVEENKVVLFISLEMTGNELLQRMMLGNARVDSDKLRHTQFTPEEWKRITRASERLAPYMGNIISHDSLSATPTDICSMAKRINESGKELSLIVFDYLQLGSSDVHTNGDVERISYLTRSFKAIAREFNVPFLYCSQFSRDIAKRLGKNKRPQLSDLRGSGSIEQDSDVVIFIYHKDNLLNEIGECKLIIAKQRGGVTKDIPVMWIPTYTRFEGVKYDEENTDGYMF